MFFYMSLIFLTSADLLSLYAPIFLWNCPPYGSKTSPKSTTSSSIDSPVAPARLALSSWLIFGVIKFDLSSCVSVFIYLFYLKIEPTNLELASDVFWIRPAKDPGYLRFFVSLPPKDWANCYSNESLKSQSSSSRPNSFLTISIMF